MCLDVFIFHFYVLPFFRKDNLFCLKNNDCLYKLYFFFILFFIFLFLFLYMYLFKLFFVYYYFLLFFPYFRGNSLNSRANLEFKEIRLFSTMIFPKKGLKFYVFSENPNGFFFFHDDFSKKKT